MKYSRFIYVTGADGTGKSTQARLLLDYLRKNGVCCKHLWLRFPFFASLPLLAYARWRKYSWFEETDGVRHGYWNFGHSWVLRVFLPWTLLVDATLAALLQIWTSLWLGKTIVCERFVLDMLVDLGVAFSDSGLHHRLPGRLYVHLLPSDATVIFLDLDTEAIRARRSDLRSDHRLEARLEAFRRLGKDYAVTVLSSRQSIDQVSKDIRKRVVA